LLWDLGLCFRSMPLKH